MHDSDPIATLDYLIPKISEKDLASLELLEGFTNDHTNQAVTAEYFKDKPFKSYPERYKKKFKNTYIANFDYTPDKANEFIKNGLADMVSFGRLYIANHDLAHKIKNNQAPNHLGNVTDYSLFPALLFGNNEFGYTDLSPYQPK